MTDASIDRAGMRCCFDYFERRGLGAIMRGAIGGVPVTTLRIHPNHCIDRQRVRCSQCGRAWVHICGEECGWHPAFSQRQFRNPLSGTAYDPGWPSVAALESLLLLVDVIVPSRVICDWTPEEVMGAADWALRVHLKASDNYHVRLPIKPKWITEAQVTPARGNEGTVFDLAPRAGQ